MSMEHVWALAFVFQLKIGGFFGTILTHTFFMFKFVEKIFLTMYLSTVNSSTIILMPKQWFTLTRVLTFSTFSSVFIVSGWPGHLSSSTSSLPSENLFCYSNTWIIDKKFSPNASLTLNVSVAAFLNFIRNSMLTHCSISLSNMIMASYKNCL